MRLSLQTSVVFAVHLLALSRASQLPDSYEREDIKHSGAERSLNMIPSDSIKLALQNFLYPKYQEGVFVDGHSAIEAVRHEDPELATKLVDVAKQDATVKNQLRKRQTSNSTIPIASSTSTTSTTTPTSTSTPIDPPTTTSTPDSTSSTSVTSDPGSPVTSPTNTPGTQTGVIIPVSVTSSLPGGGITTQSTNAFATSAPTSLVVPITTTNAKSQTYVISNTVPAAVFTNTDSAGSAHITTSPLSTVQVANGGSIIPSGPTTPIVTTTTDPNGNVRTITITPVAGTVSEIHVSYTTLPNSQVITLTSYAVVAPPTETDDAVKPTQTSTAKGHLQSDAAAVLGQHAMKMAVFVGAAAGVAAYF